MNPKYKSIIKILGQNEDSTIIYEMYVEDTLYQKGTFKTAAKYDDQNFVTRFILPNNILPNKLYDDELFFSFGDKHKSKNYIGFKNHASEKTYYFYVYERIK